MERRRKAYSGNRIKTEWTKAFGIVGSYEVTNRGQGWHPHAHMLVLADSRMDAQAMKDEWLRITGDSHVLRIDPAHHPDDPARDFLEVFKYALKFSDLTPAQNVEAFQALRENDSFFGRHVSRRTHSRASDRRSARRRPALYRIPLPVLRRSLRLGIYS